LAAAHYHLIENEPFSQFFAVSQVHTAQHHAIFQPVIAVHQLLQPYWTVILADFH